MMPEVKLTGDADATCYVGELLACGDTHRRILQLLDTSKKKKKKELSCIPNLKLALMYKLSCLYVPLFFRFSFDIFFIYTLHSLPLFFFNFFFLLLLLFSGWSFNAIITCSMSPKAFAISVPHFPFWTLSESLSLSLSHTHTRTLCFCCLNRSQFSVIVFFFWIELKCCGLTQSTLALLLDLPLHCFVGRIRR